MRQRIHVRVAQRDGPGQHEPVGQQPMVAGHLQHQPAGQVVLGQHHVGQVVAATQGQVPGRDPAVGLGQAHLRAVEQHGQQRPAPVGLADLGEPARTAGRGGQAAAQAVPAGQVQPGLRPGEHPGDRAQVVQADHADAPAGRAGPDAQPADLLQRADPGQPLGEARGLHQLPVGAQRGRLHRLRHRPEPPGRDHVALADHGRGGEEHGGGDLLQMALRDDRVRVPGEDDFALLGDLEPAVHRARGLGQHRAAGRAAPPAQRAAPAVEQGQPHIVVGRPPGQLLLRVEQAQGGADRPEFLGGVGVAEHDLQLTAVRREAIPDRLQLQHLVQHPGGVVQVLAALEQRHHVQHRRSAAPRRVPGQLVDGGDVRRRPGEAHHVTTARLDPEPVLDPGRGPERRQHLRGLVGQGAARADLAQRAGVHRAVLPDLQLGQVEPERLGLPDELLQLAERLPGGAPGGQGLLHQPQVGEEAGGARVGQVRMPQPGGLEPPGQVEEVGPVRFVR